MQIRFIIDYALFIKVMSVVVEHTFCILKSRFRCLRTFLQLDLHNSFSELGAKTASVCAHKKNIISDHTIFSEFSSYCLKSVPV